MPVTLVSGNTRTIYAGKQSAKGTAQNTPTVKLPLTEDSFDPNRTLIQLPETDSSAQTAGFSVVGAQPGGTLSKWLRSSEDNLFMEAVQGAGSANVWTPGQNAPWLTIFDVIPGVLCTKYIDCRVISATWAGAAGQGITSQYVVEGLTAEVGATEPVTPASASTDRVLVYPDVTVTRGGTHLGDVDAFSLTVNRGGEYFFGDNGLSPVDRPMGLYGVEGSLTIAFQDDDEYRAFNTGATAGTSLTTTIYNQALTILADNAVASESVSWAMTQIQYSAFPVPLDTGGAPIRVAAAFRTNKQATIANNLTITTEP
jgi:hypothetical protein